MTDKSTVRQVLGMLMQHPQYMSQVDKYTLTLADFPTRFDKYLFSAISNLYRKGATKIFPIDVATYLETDTVGKKVFEQNNGIDYLQDAIDFSSWENFSYYYDRLKKFNLLRDLKKGGHDVSKFYCEDLTKPDAELINAKFEQLTVTDICNSLKRELLQHEANYVKNSEIVEETAAAGIRDFIQHLDSNIVRRRLLHGTDNS